MYLRVHTGIFLRKIENSYLSGLLQQIGTLIAKWNSRTRRVDKGKSGQAQKTAVSGGFGGGILSVEFKGKRFTFLGERVALVTQLKSNNSGAAD
ncbi:MAG TPA: hypothetical protein VGQ39_19235 [Pyrinomonadaceae bacterium]|nr:hypothetical protein [Pyrinomonadaceae bacterium]